MGNDLKIDLNFEDESIKEEHIKQLFGGDIYKYSYKLPIIFTNTEEKDLYYYKLFKIYIETTLELFTNISLELPDLFDEIYKIHNVMEEKNQKNDYINQTCSEYLTQLFYAIKQSNNIYYKLEIENNSAIKGDEYCFIVLALNNASGIYNFIYELFLSKKYPNEKTLETMRERMSLLFSPEFQSLRVSFKCIECLESITTKDTFH